jgi:outer membrane lipoprotein-sorting protein
MNMNVLRRLPLYRLLLLAAVVIAVGVGATAIALALGSGPKPAPKPLAQAVHDALSAAPVEGVSANITLSNHLLEGASLAGGSSQGGELASSPLLAGASGRLWAAKDGRVRLELQAEKGDTQVIYDGHTITLYDAATNTVYRYTPPPADHSSGAAAEEHQVPSVAKIEEAIANAKQHASVSGATPDDVAGRPAYTVRVAPKEGGSLLGGAELSFDAANGAPLRAAIYSSTSQNPVIELAASEVSFGPVAASVFEFTPPANAKVEEISTSAGSAGTHSSSGEDGEKPTLKTSGKGPSTVAVIEKKLPAGAKQGSAGALEGLPKVNINGVSATELRTELGTLLSFERSGVRYVLAGSVTPGAIEALARGL